jgi:voltage-gated potassium channel
MDNSSKLDFLNILVFILTIYVLGALVVDTFFNLSPETSRLLNYFDYFICMFFLIEFLFRFFKSSNKKDFMKWGWIDLLACIPMIDFLRAGRLLRLIRLFRIIRAFKTTKQFIHHIFSNKAQGALTSASILAVLLIIFSSIAILEFEDNPQSNIKTAEDAIWWSYTTITTVGYGDKYPVTLEGRIIAMALMTFGVGLFGTFTAYVSSLFVQQNNKQS